MRFVYLFVVSVGSLHFGECSLFFKNIAVDCFFKLTKIIKMAILFVDYANLKVLSVSSKVALHANAPIILLSN